ncbi:hypothetical protein MAPG_01667 [Magnaporthiopsis poae ATCC 64411]|uniref:Nucleoside phosphorylase domain-containing protein n=1 Tax=Magnaporthiopsis poae (strain ATCC 64411 / 73-15) TaxID=644358 RepID=A0A0C4DPA7_MAGP6|nr:hypothetical protein MAPG_01667 [Magnaporthiopsis poae ATCC 64411]
MAGSGQDGGCSVPQTGDKLVPQEPARLKPPPTPPPSQQRRPFVVKDASLHTMGDVLVRYVESKIHQDIRERDWSRIVVRGRYVRHQPAECEKQHKMFNKHRPVTRVLYALPDGEEAPVGEDGYAGSSATGGGRMIIGSTSTSELELSLNCFPGVEYSQHYASLVATYLALSGKNPGVVTWEPPSASVCEGELSGSNLSAMGPVDIVLIGYVAQLAAVEQREWEGGLVDGGLFSWQKRSLANGTTVAYLTCMVSFWGDISYHLIAYLQRVCGMRCLLYVGKAGSLKPKVNPNEWLVTGDACYTDDGHAHQRVAQGRDIPLSNKNSETRLRWTNALDREVADSHKVLVGDIVTVPSPLCETHDWLREWAPPRARWVDCEVGHMALASKRGGTAFGYLHLVSDNVAEVRDENLVTENLESVRAKRKLLMGVVDELLEAFFVRCERGEGPEQLYNRPGGQ